MLLDDIKSYLNTQINADTELGKVNISQQYPYGTEAKPPELLIDIIDMPEYDAATDFCGEKASVAMLQIIVMANEMKFGNTKYGAQKSCDKLSAKVCDWFKACKIKTSHSHILNTRRVQKSNALPYSNGTTTYYSILRFELTVAQNN